MIEKRGEDSAEHTTERESFLESRKAPEKHRVVDRIGPDVRGEESELGRVWVKTGENATEEGVHGVTRANVTLLDLTNAPTSPV